MLSLCLALVLRLEDKVISCVHTKFFKLHLNGGNVFIRCSNKYLWL